MASSSEEIMAVYFEDIAKMSKIVEEKFGKVPFYDNFKGMSVRNNLDYDPTRVKNKGKK